MSKKCLISISGGLGKNVMITSLMPELAKKYEEIYVISPYYDVFKCCSYVTDAFPSGKGSLYLELVLDKDCDVLMRNPYDNSRFIKKQCHLFDAWAEDFGFELTKNANDYFPIIDKIEEVYPNNIKDANEKINSWNNDFIMVQFCGGQSPLNDMDKTQYDMTKESLKRNYFKGQELINTLKKEYPTSTIVHYGLPNEISYENTVKEVIPYLEYRYLSKFAKKVVCIDSSLQHLVSGVCDDVTVIWGETRPQHFGYSCNKNICASNVANLQPYFKELGISPSIVNMPSVEEIMNVVTMEKK